MADTELNPEPSDDGKEKQKHEDNGGGWREEDEWRERNTSGI